MTSFDESKIARAADGKFAPNQSSEADAGVLDGADTRTLKDLPFDETNTCDVQVLAGTEPDVLDEFVDAQEYADVRDGETMLYVADVRVPLSDEQELMARRYPRVASVAIAGDLDAVVEHHGRTAVRVTADVNPGEQVSGLRDDAERAVAGAREQIAGADERVAQAMSDWGVNSPEQSLAEPKLESASVQAHVDQAQPYAPASALLPLSTDHDENMDLVLSRAKARRYEQHDDGSVTYAIGDHFVTANPDTPDPDPGRPVGYGQQRLAAPRRRMDAVLAQMVGSYAPTPEASHAAHTQVGTPDQIRSAGNPTHVPLRVEGRSYPAQSQIVRAGDRTMVMSSQARDALYPSWRDSSGPAPF